jgi:hypothetical protein
MPIKSSIDAVTTTRGSTPVPSPATTDANHHVDGQAATLNLKELTWNCTWSNVFFVCMPLSWRFFLQVLLGLV